MSRILHTNKYHGWLIAMMLLVMNVPNAVSGQQTDGNDILYHSFRSPQSARYNPSFFPKDSRWYFSLPDVDLELGLPLSYSNLGLVYDPSRNASVLNINRMLNNISNRPFNLGLDADVDLLGLGFKTGDYVAVQVGSGLRNITDLTVPTEILDFLANGNAGETRVYDFGDEDIFRTTTMAYVSLGITFQLPDLPVWIGARGKLLNGLHTLNVDNLKLELATADDMNSMSLSTDFMARESGLMSMDIGDNGEFMVDDDLRLPTNYGVSFDLGAHARLGAFDFSFSILDLGPGITWSDSSRTFSAATRDKTISFDGIDINRLIDDQDGLWQSWEDSLAGMLNYVRDITPFTDPLPTRMYAGLSVTISDMLRLGYMFRGQWNKGDYRGDSFRCNNSLSLHANLADWIELSVANSMVFDGKIPKFFNPGASMIFSFATRLQVYVAADYVSSIYLADMRSAHVMVGLNIVGQTKDR